MSYNYILTSPTAPNSKPLRACSPSPLASLLIYFSSELPPKPYALTILSLNTTENSLILTWVIPEIEDTNATSLKVEATTPNNQGKVTMVQYTPYECGTGEHSSTSHQECQSHYGTCWCLSLLELFGVRISHSFLWH